MIKKARLFLKLNKI